MHVGERATDLAGEAGAAVCGRGIEPTASGLFAIPVGGAAEGGGGGLDLAEAEDGARGLLESQCLAGIDSGSPATHIGLRDGDGHGQGITSDDFFHHGLGGERQAGQVAGLGVAFRADVSHEQAAAIEAGANEVEPLTSDQNDDIPPEVSGARFICERTAVHAVAKWLSSNGWTIVTSELGYVPKQFPELTEAQKAEAGEFLHELDEHDDVHRVWAALK